MAIEDIRKVVAEVFEEKLMKIPSLWPRWLPLKEAVRYSGMSERMLRKLAKEGEIYATKPGGGKMLFDRESIDDFLLREKAEINTLLNRFGKVRYSG